MRPKDSGENSESSRIELTKMVNVLKFNLLEVISFDPAVGWEYHEKLEKHASQKDYATGFGGKYGIQKDKMDKCAVGWEHKEKVEKHASQKGQYDHSSF